MSKFNKCKHCGNTKPESGWIGSSNSLCGECHRVIQEVHTERRFAIKKAKLEALRARREYAPSLSSMLAIAAGTIGGLK